MRLGAGAPEVFVRFPTGEKREVPGSRRAVTRPQPANYLAAASRGWDWGQTPESRS